jgi:hypothetical protein
MALAPPGLVTARDLFAKLRRDAAVLDRRVTSDGLFNFVVTGYSLIEWIKNDPSVPATAKASAEVQGLYADQWIKVCGDIATAGKHFTLTKRKPITTKTTSQKGFGHGRFGKGPFGVGEESITIDLSDGSIHNALDLVRQVVTEWEAFFKRHAI